MTRTIRKEQIIPGMTIAWAKKGVTYGCEVKKAQECPRVGAVLVHSTLGGFAYVYNDTVEVIAEPQPEEPEEFGARVVVDGRRFLRSPEGKNDDQPWLEENEGAWYEWAALCDRGSVMVVPDQGWAVPADTPEVPERIEEWPEDDTALRKHKWRDEYGEVWRHGRNSHVEGWTRGYLFQDKPLCGPWERVTDA